MKRFEYHIFKLEVAGLFRGGKLDTATMDQHINEAGSDGWELVSAFDTNQWQGMTREVIMIFKREKQG